MWITSFQINTTTWSLRCRYVWFSNLKATFCQIAITLGTNYFKYWGFLDKSKARPKQYLTLSNFTDKHNSCQDIWMWHVLACQAFPKDIYLLYDSCAKMIVFDIQHISLGSLCLNIDFDSSRYMQFSVTRLNFHQ